MPLPEQHMRLRGVRIKISFFFTVGLALIVGAEIGERLIITLVSALLHEAAHLLCLISYGDKPKEVHLRAVGIQIIRAGSTRLSLLQEMITSLAGVVVNLFVALVLLTMHFALKMDSFIIPTTINLGLGALNLMPIAPLDGSKVLYYALAIKKDEETAKRITDIVGMAVIFPMSLVGFYVLIKSGYNFTLLAISIYLGIYLFIKK